MCSSTNASRSLIRSGVFFLGLAPGSPPPDAVVGKSGQGVSQLAAAAANGFHVHAGDPREPTVTAMADLQRLQGHVPSSVVLIEATEQQVRETMDLTLRMIAHLTIGAATRMRAGFWHEAPRFRTEGMEPSW